MDYNVSLNIYTNTDLLDQSEQALTGTHFSLLPFFCLLCDKTTVESESSKDEFASVADAIFSDRSRVTSMGSSLT